jgi:hypothetical protein
MIPGAASSATAVMPARDYSGIMPNALKRGLPDGALRIVATGEKEDPTGVAGPDPAEPWPIRPD